MRKNLILSLSLLAMLLPTATASAAAPDIGRFDDGFNSFTDPDVCASDPWGFDVNATEHEYGTFQAFLDASGNVTKVIVHFNYDAWISYQRKILSGRVEWRTQLNVRNIFTHNDLIPVGRNPDGSVAVWSIAEGRKFTLATKFSF